VLAGLAEIAPGCLAATRYTIIEPSAALRDAQREKLAPLPGARVAWVASLAELPAFTGIHFSNELIDAFPVHAVEWDGAEWRELCVESDGERLQFAIGPAVTGALHEQLFKIGPLPVGYRTEVNLDALDWMRTLAGKLTRGFVLAIDYGHTRAEFYRPDRTAGTLAAYSEHRREPDPLARPGEIDLTAHVDFTSLAEAAAACGLAPAGFADQHHLMVGLGRLHFPDTGTPDARALRAFKTLMHPTMLGRSFHALCLSRGVDPAPPLSGFTFARGSL
jgi:SAM-dependent MidA family methyltransferase